MPASLATFWVPPFPQRGHPPLFVWVFLLLARLCYTEWIVNSIYRCRVTNGVQGFSVGGVAELVASNDAVHVGETAVDIAVGKTAPVRPASEESSSSLYGFSTPVGCAVEGCAFEDLLTGRPRFDSSQGFQSPASAALSTPLAELL